MCNGVDIRDLRNLRMAVIDYDNLLYLSAYDEA